MGSSVGAKGRALDFALKPSLNNFDGSFRYLLQTNSIQMSSIQNWTWHHPSIHEERCIVIANPVRVSTSVTSSRKGAMWVQSLQKGLQGFGVFWTSSFPVNRWRGFFLDFPRLVQGQRDSSSREGPLCCSFVCSKL
jgi:hypothetical protein